jgi:hypothetical protein
MSKANSLESDYLKALFQNVADSKNIFGNTAGTTPINQAGAATSLYFGLHTADPGETGDQTTNETAYTGYARKALTRNASNFTVSGDAPTQVALAADLNFDPCTAAPGANLTHFSVGTDAAGAGRLLYKGAVTPNITMGVGTIPRLTTGTIITED